MQHKLLTLLICSWLGAVQAAELGDVAPRSYIGQPLAADIDLLALTPDELANLQVRLADANVYRGANVAMNPALASVRLQVERRGQKPVLHVSTTRPIEAEYVHLYLRLGAPGKQDVRLATVWLQPDPNPAPPPSVVPAASAMTPAQAEQIAAQARATRGAAARESAAKDAVAKEAGRGAVAKEAAGRDAAVKEVTGRDAVAKEAAGRDAAAKEAAAKEVAARDAAAADEAAQQAAATPARDRSKPAPLPSMHEAETGVPGEVKAAAAARRIAGVWVTADGKPTRAPTNADPVPVPVGVAQALLPLAPLPLPKGVKRPAPASCPPSGMSAKECQALDAHNAELSSKLVELEGKMKALQGALGGAAPTAIAAAPTAAPAASATASKAGAAASPAPAAVPAASAAGAASVTTAASKARAATSATANLSARAEPEAHAAKASVSGAASAQTAAGKGGAKEDGAAVTGAGTGAAANAAGASAEASAAASGEASAPVATKQVRVLPKLKYRKEKPPEPQTDYTLPLAAGGVGLLALLGAGFFWWRKKKSGKGPLKIWQGFRKNKASASPSAAAAPAAAQAAEAEPVTQ